MISSVFEELSKSTESKELKEMPNESGKYLLFKGLRVQGLKEIQSYSLFFLFNAIEVKTGLKEADAIKTKLKEILTLENVPLPNRVSLEEVRSSFNGLLHSYEFVVSVELKGV